MLSKKMQIQFKKKSPIRSAYEEGKRLEKIYGADQVFDLSIGNPQAKVPKKVGEVIRELLEAKNTDLHSYMCDAGYENVRKKIADSLNKRFETKFEIQNIIMSMGAAGAMNAAMYALLDPGDEVMLMRPYYPGYLSFIINWNAVAVSVNADAENFQPDLLDFERKITEKTKLVIVNSPNNPTGAVYTVETIQRIASILEKKQAEYSHEIYLLSDEPYRELVYDQKELPYWTSYYDNTLVVYSFSKTLSIPGERIGYLVIPDEVSQSAEMIQAVRTATGMLGYVNAPALFQQVVGECLEEKVDIEFYRRNRDILYNGLVALGFAVVPPQGAFYLFVKAPKEDEEAFLKAAHTCKILMVGGRAFDYPGYVRISFCVSEEKIRNSLRAFEKLAGMVLSIVL